MKKSAIPGFPWMKQFTTKDEINQYFTVDKIQYLLCGKRFKALPQHLERTHDITADDYREQYGLPWRRGLCGVGTSKKFSKNMIVRQKNGFRPPIEAAHRKAVKAKRRPDQPYFKKVKIENLECFNKDNRKYLDDDYQKVLIKMLKETKGLYETCKDDDMPDIGMVHKYAKRNKEFRKALDRTYEKLPYSIQAGAGKLPEKKFKEDLLSFRRSGITVADMSRLLGVSRSLINNRLNKIRESKDNI